MSKLIGLAMLLNNHFKPIVIKTLIYLAKPYKSTNVRLYYTFTFNCVCLLIL